MLNVGQGRAEGGTARPTRGRATFSTLAKLTEKIKDLSWKIVLQSTSSYYGELGSRTFYKLRSIFAIITAYKVSYPQIFLCQKNVGRTGVIHVGIV